MFRRNYALVCLSLLGLLACASNRGEGGYPARVSLLSYDDGWRIELRSESHTAPVELYSQRRAQNDIKVTTDDVMSAFVEFLRAEGFAEHSVQGSAPASAPAGITRALEIEVKGSSRHLISGPGAPRESSIALAQLTPKVLDLYNRIQGFQRVESQKGAEVFVGPPPR